MELEAPALGAHLVALRASKERVANPVAIPQNGFDQSEHDTRSYESRNAFLT